MRRFIAAATLAVALAQPALGHEGGRHVKGVVKALEAQRLVVTDVTGQDVPFTVTRATKFVRGEKGISWREVRPGERVVVHGELEGATRVAGLVMLAVPRKE